MPTGLAAALTRVDGQAGDRSVTPIAMSDLEPKYRHSVGELDLDLSRLQIPAGSRTPINISMGVGRIEVVVPWDADVESKASVGAGTFELFGNRQTGVNLNGRTHVTGQPGAPVLVISGRPASARSSSAGPPSRSPTRLCGPASRCRCSAPSSRPGRLPPAQ